MIYILFACSMIAVASSIVSVVYAISAYRSRKRAEKSMERANEAWKRVSLLKAKTSDLHDRPRPDTTYSQWTA